jgi:hypothetical protein
MGAGRLQQEQQRQQQKDWSPARAAREAHPLYGGPEGRRLLARQERISEATLRRYESGALKCPFERAVRLARRLGPTACPKGDWVYVLTYVPPRRRGRPAAPRRPTRDLWGRSVLAAGEPLRPGPGRNLPRAAP